MAKKICMYSFKGGTGVTSLCIGLGSALAERGERTLIVDGDNKSGCGLIACNLSGMAVYTLADYARGACRAKQTVIPHPSYSNLLIMPSLGLTDEAFAARAVAEVDGLFDYILLDNTLPKICDRAIIVTEPYAPSVKSADACRSFLADGGVKEIGLMVNKINGGQVISGEVPSAQEISKLLRLKLIAVIPEDLTLSSGGMKNITRRAFRLAADVVTGVKDGVINICRSYSGAGGLIMRKLRSRI